MTNLTDNPAPEEQKPSFDTDFENITPWNGQNDNGRDVRLKWMRNFERIKRNFLSIGSIISSKLDGLDLKFLHRDREDDTNFVIRFLAGIVVKKLLLADHLQSTSFTSGLLGSGFVIKKDADGRAYIETDDLMVRRRALFAVLEILKERYIAGDFIQGPGGGKCKKVVEYDTFYRCYILADDGDKAVENTFDIDDQVRCQEFNVKPGVHHNVSNQYYWRRCIAVGDDYIDLSKTDCDKGSMTPKAGDDMATMGNRTNPDRQNVSVLGVYGNDAPYYKQYIGVNSYDLTGRERTVVSPHGNKFTGQFYFTSGEDAEAAFSEIKKAYEDNLTYVQALEDELNSVKNQLDGNITTWFLDPVPSLQNEPYISWADDQERDLHLKDLYFDKKGQIYRFEKRSGVYQWLVVEDEQLAKALADAKKAQDTADGKRRVFVVQPKPPYDEGDLWVNANYGNTYKDELLKCNTGVHKENGSFSIQDWSKASDYTTESSVKARFKATNDKIEGVVRSVSTMNGKLTNQETRITQTETDIKSKASKTTVDTLSGRITENATAIEQNANAIKLKVSQEDLENATKNMAGINLLPAEEDAWEWGYFSPGASSGSAWGEMTTDVQSSIRTKGLVYIGLGSAHLYAKAHMSGYSFSIAQFDEDGKYCGKTSSTAWNRELKFTTNSSCRYIAVSIKKDSGSIYTFHAYYAQIKIELGDVPTAFTPCTNKDVNAGLLSTGIDILNKKIILTADQTLIQSNTGQVIVFFGSDSEGGIKLNSDVYVTFIKAVKGSIGGFTITNGSITSGSGDSLVSLSPSGLKIGTSGGSFFAGAGGIGFTGKPRIGLDGGCMTAFKMLVSRTTQSSILDLEDPNYNGFFVNGRPRNGTTDNIVIPMRKRAVAGYRFLVQIIDYSGTCTLDTGGYYDSGGGWRSGNIQIRDRKAREFMYDGQRWHEYFCSN